GQFLFERTRTMHSILSLSLVEWLHETDVLAFAESLDEPDRVMSVSWFEFDDEGARRGAAALHRGHRELARSAPGGQGVWYSAADSPKGTHHCLARGLAQHGSFRIVSVCGHGNSHMAGIELGDGVWDGSTVTTEGIDGSWRQAPACDLHAIEL